VSWLAQSFMFHYRLLVSRLKVSMTVRHRESPPRPSNACVSHARPVSVTQHRFALR